MHKIGDYLENHGGVLYIEGLSSAALAKRYDTPLYVYSASRIEKNYLRLERAFKRHYKNFRIHYSLKANDNLTILKILKNLGASADASSPYEVFLVKKAGIKNVLYSGIYYRDDEIKYGVKSGATITLDDPSKLTILKRNNYKQPVTFRVNPGVGEGGFKEIVTGGKEAKFGIVKEEIVEAYQKAKAMGFQEFGIHMMTGSCVLNPNHFPNVTNRLLKIVGGISKKLGIQFQFIDIGGGFGIPYEEGERELDIEKTARLTIQVLKSKLKEYRLGEPTLVVEPGRYIVGDAAVLLTRVTETKRKPKKFVGVDAGMNTLIRPMLYGAHHPIVLANDLNAASHEQVNIVGQICESTDVLAKNRLMPHLKEGDTLAILNAGAYGFSMSSTYGGRPRPAEVLVRGRKQRLIRRRASFRELLGLY